MKDQADEKNQPVSESQWVTMLDQYVTRNQPQLKDEYGSEYDHFLTEMTNDSMDMLVEIIQEGMDPTEARQVVIAGMLEEIDSAYPSRTRPFRRKLEIPRQRIRRRRTEGEV